MGTDMALSCNEWSMFKQETYNSTETGTGVLSTQKCQEHPHRMLLGNFPKGREYTGRDPRDFIAYTRGVESITKVTTT